MGLIDRLRRLTSLPQQFAAAQYGSPWANSAHLAIADFPDLEDSAINRDYAMQIPALLRARNLVVTTIARVPLTAVEGTAPAWIAGTVPSTGKPQTEFYRMLWTADDLFFYGRSAWAIERDAQGVPTVAIHIPLALWNYSAEGDVIVDGEVADPAEVCTFSGIHAGILEHGADALRDAHRLNRASARVADAPAALTELRQTNDAILNDDEIDALIARYVQARQGRRHGVSYSSPGVEVVEHSLAPENLLIAGRNAATVDIARLANLPAPFIDATVGGTSLSYENSTSRMTELIAFGLSPTLAAITARLNLADMNPAGAKIRFDTERILDDIPTAATPNLAPNQNVGPGAGSPNKGGAKLTPVTEGARHA
ncbi:phage portal protein [Corynebacterium striatum]|uniref:Phage portal protein n=1 Tax=Corynebacterium striatum TaxID=43770 RepID=A0ABX7DFE9_CORST|nr:phage portal protein [Corynebacterium striatum]QQU76453.1 phage portal protein [Corynebacterium striatum]